MPRPETPAGTVTPPPPWAARCSVSLQNPSVVEVGRDLWTFSSPAEQVTQERVQAGLECLLEGRLHALPGQLFSVPSPSLQS